MSEHDVPPEVVGASQFQMDAAPHKEDGGATAANAIASTYGDDVAPAGTFSAMFGFDLQDLWGGGYEEFVNEDADQIGEAYEASILGGMIGVDDDCAGSTPEDTTASHAQDKSFRGDGRDATKKMSAKGLISNFVLSIIGSTTLGLTAQMKAGGWILGPLMVLAGCFVVVENTRLVNATIDKLQTERGLNIIAYPDFAQGAFGIWGKRVSSVTSMCALIGIICTSLVLEGHNFNFVLPVTWPWFGCTHCGHKWWALFLTPVTVLYVFGNPGTLMKRTAFLGPLVCLLTVVFAWAGAGASIADASDIPESCQVERMVVPSPAKFFSGEFILQLAGVGSYGFYSFAVIVTVPTLRNQMKKEKRTAPAAIFAYFLSLVLFLPIMLLGYAGFGQLTPENLIDGMRSERPDGWWALNRPFETGTITGAGSCLDFIVTINLLLTEAIYIPCAVLAVEASFPGVFRKGPRWTRTAMRIWFVCFRLFVATSVESFVAMSSLVSSLFCVCNNILIPILAFHWTKAQDVSIARKAVHVVIFMYGVFILVLGTYSSLGALSPAEVQLPGTVLRDGISEECKSAYESATASSG